MSEKVNMKIVFGALAGGLYTLFGLFQVLISLGIGSDLGEMLYIPGDIIGGLILILIGAVFLFGVSELRSGIGEGAAYIYVGIGLALLFTAIYLLVIGGNFLEAHLIMSEDFAEWSPMDDIKPGIYLGLIPLIGAIVWRDKISLRRISKAGA